MPFEPGNTLGGRKPGSKNKTTEEIRESFQELLENNLSKLQSDLDKLDPEERLKIILTLSKFVLPTLKTTELKGNKQQPIIVNLD
ncbi:MAG: hypothetical protein ACQEWD_11375 [Bacteroidota bacterium]